jgi:hypothetical protein
MQKLESNMYFVFTAWKTAKCSGPLDNYSNVYWSTGPIKQCVLFHWTTTAMCSGPLVHHTNYHIKGQICEGVIKIRQSDNTDFSVCRSALFILWTQLAAAILISLCNTVLPQVLSFHLNGTCSILNHSYGTAYGS